MQYFVLDGSGNQYGPADVATLRQWAAENRLSRASMLRDVATGQTQPASSVAGIFDDGPYAPPLPMAPPMGDYQNPPHYSQYQRPYQQTNSSDLTWAWVCAIGGIICCGILAIIGVIQSNKVLKNGDEQGRAPLIVSWIGIGLWVIGVIFQIFVAGAVGLSGFR